MFLKNIYIVILLSALLAACGSSQPTADSALNSAYTSAGLDLNANLELFHFHPDSTRLYIQLDTDNLLYAKQANGEPSAIVLVDIKPKGDKALGAPPIEAKTIRIVDRDEKKIAKTLLASTDFYLPKGYAYEIEINFKDVNSDRFKTYKRAADKTAQTSREYFSTYEDKERLKPLFKDRVKPFSTYYLKVPVTGPEQITVYFYDRTFPLPPPPFALYQPDRFDYEPDSVFYLSPDSSGSVELKTTDQGFYHFLQDTTSKQGYTLFISPEEFPEVKNVRNMVEPFRFLVGSKEYKSILEADDMKRQLESYWIDWAGSKERARKSIQTFYNRVEEANTYFSSHVEGWKSDRGIVYVIYGKPNKVYKTELVETWIYGEENNPLSITFNFVKVINPFTENDYRLNREEYYKPSWYRSVNAWRDGRIY